MLLTTIEEILTSRAVEHRGVREGEVESLASDDSHMTCDLTGADGLGTASQRFLSPQESVTFSTSLDLWLLLSGCP